MKTPNIATREEWLNAIASALRPTFQDLGHPLPEKLRVSRGWPSKGGLSKKKRVRGQCWYPDCSADGTTEVFISPWLGNDPLVPLVLAHELVHAAIGPGHGHKGLFIEVARALGLLKPWTTATPTPELEAKLQGLVDAVGPYPHATLDDAASEAGGGDKPGGTRLLKVACDCGYTVRVTRKWLDALGAPKCPHNDQPMKEAA